MSNNMDKVMPPDPLTQMSDNIDKATPPDPLTPDDLELLLIVKACEFTLADAPALQQYGRMQQRRRDVLEGRAVASPPRHNWVGESMCSVPEHAIMVDVIDLFEEDIDPDAPIAKLPADELERMRAECDLDAVARLSGAATRWAALQFFGARNYKPGDQTQDHGELSPEDNQLLRVVKAAGFTVADQPALYVLRGEREAYRQHHQRKRLQKRMRQSVLAKDIV